MPSSSRSRPSAGLVTEVNVADNQRVAAGEVLVRIDAERYQLAVAEAEATLANPDRTWVRRYGRKGGRCD